jgi:hypothetical protein
LSLDCISKSKTTTNGLIKEFGSHLWNAGHGGNKLVCQRTHLREKCHFFTVTVGILVVQMAARR